jgi:hypothetical protein
MSAPVLRGRGTRVAAAASVILALVAAFYTPAPTTGAPPDRVVQKKLPDTMLRMRVTDVTVEDNPVTGAPQLVAWVALGDHDPEPYPIDLSSVPADAGGAGDLVVAQQACGILDLALGPIELDVLGLNVVTSEICLRVTGETGPGNLLGNLLCALTGILDNGGLLGDFLDTLTDAELDALLQGIQDLLNGALAQVTAPTSVVGVSNSADGVGIAQVNGGQCDILNLSLGPIDLNLLGLDVELDDCDGGPVTVDVFAEPGAGNLLGNLLCNLAGLLDGPAAGPAIANALNRVAAAIEALVAVLG